MTFLIKKIKKLSGGREFVKEETIDKPELLVGRATDSDIYLPDLRISLKHAKISIRGKNGFAVSAVGEKPVLDGNRVAKGFAYTSKETANIRIGAYHLNISRNADGPVEIELEQVSQEALVKSDLSEEGVFSLKKTVWGKRSTAWIFLTAVLAAFLILPIIWFTSGHQSERIAGIKPDEAWLSGPMSVAHASLAADCKSCHKQAFQSVRDNVCLDCHKGLPDHADPADMKLAQPMDLRAVTDLKKLSSFFGRPPERCASCHSEHNGTEGIVLSAQSLCSDCHRNMMQELPNTNVLNVSDFTADHPEFRPTLVSVKFGEMPTFSRTSLDAKPIENSGLKFPHDMHLDSEGGVAKMASTLPEFFEGRSVLECADCHKPDAGGALFETPRMETNCAMCHSLAFDREGDEIRTLRHGKPKEVIASMDDFYLAQALKEITETDEIGDRRRPGAAARLAEDKRREEAIAKAQERAAFAVASIFSEGGACFDCHNVQVPEDGNAAGYDIEKVVLADSFMPNSIFNHRSHESGDLECATCHASETSKLATDVLLPSITTCQECHGGEATADRVPSTCIMCHGFHEGSHGAMSPARIETALAWPQRG